MSLLFPAALLQAQGNFVNLDFEAATIPPGTQPNTIVSATGAFPGWNGNAQTSYDEGGLADTVISILDSSAGAGFIPFQGNYSAFLYTLPGPPAQIPATLSQTGLVPAGSRSLTIDLAGVGVSTFALSLGGQNLPLTLLAIFPTYGEYGADVSAFAGQQEQLALIEQSYSSRTPRSGIGIDDIEFSLVPIPEPSAWGLIVCGAALNAVLRNRRIGWI